MANYGVLIGIAIVIVALTFGVPFILAEVFPWQSLYKQRHGKPTVTTKSYKGRTALITGANGAFGSRAAKLFAHREIETLILVDLMDCGPVKEQIEAELKEMGKPLPNILVWRIDMSTFAGCLDLGKKARELKNLDHALMTAGILSFNRRESPEGWETSIQVNFLSTALNGLLVLPHLKSSPSNPNPPVLTFVTTFGIYPSGPTMSVPKQGSYLKRLSNNKDGTEQGFQYGRSKGLLLYFTRELATRTAAIAKAGKGMRKVTINSGDPGSAWTGLTAPQQTMLLPRLIMNIGARDPLICATALTNAVSASEDANGKIMQDFATATYPPFMDRKKGHIAQKRVWEETRAELETKIPEIKAVYKLLDA